MLPNVKVRDLSELIKVEREQTPEIYSISNQIRSQIPGCVDVKIEVGIVCHSTRIFFRQEILL